MPATSIKRMIARGGLRRILRSCRNFWGGPNIRQLLQTMAQGDALPGALHAAQQGRACGVSHRSRRPRLVKLNPDAAKLLGRYRVRTVKDVLDLPAWPYGGLRIAIERWPLTDVTIEPV
jgi:hypothetical protein